MKRKYDQKRSTTNYCKNSNVFTVAQGLLALLGVLVFQLCISTKSIGQTYYGNGLPYFNTLNGSSPTGVTLGGNATNTTSDGIQLTPQANNQGGYFYLTNTNLQTGNGLHVEFEYSSSDSVNGADGLSMILYGGTAAGNFNMGYVGAGLGYTYNKVSDNKSSGGVKGVVNGYLALGLDEYGNFKNVFSQNSTSGNSYREGLVPSGAGWRNGTQNVTLRGPGNPNAETGNIDAWYSGYPVLYTVTTNPTGSTGDYGASLNTSDGTYSYQTANTIANNFTIATGTKTWDPTNADYRKAFIDIVPISSSNYMITVKIQHGATTDVVVNGYLFPTTSITAIDNSKKGDVGGTSNTISSTLPTTLYIAFTGSTGGFNNAHYIRNLTANTPYIAGVMPDTLNICNSTTSPYTVSNVLANDSAYSGSPSSPTASASNIDNSTFRFSNDSASVNLANTITPGTTVTATNSYGTWVFTIASGNVMFTPATGNTTGNGIIYYSIKGKNVPYSNEPYRAIGRAINVINQNTAITTTSLPNATTNQAYSAQVLPSGTGFSYTAMGLPSPISISSAGLISGTWPSNGTYPVTVTLTNAYGCTASSTLNITASGALPVTYLQPLTGNSAPNGVNLTWATAIEANNKLFAVQRSIDGINWETIGNINSYFSNGNGNSHSYSFVDNTPVNGNNFYRLNQIDLDGNSQFSNAVMVAFSNAKYGSHTYIAPNPVIGQLNVYNIPANATLRIINATGQILKTITTYNLNQVVDISNLASGFYLLRVVSQNNQISNTVRFFKK